MAAKGSDGPRKLPSKPTNQQITLAKAVEYTKRYQRSAPASEKAGFFFAAGLRKLLGQRGVHGMRIYHGLDKDGRYRMVLVGVDKDGSDIAGSSAAPRRATKMAASLSSGQEVLLDTHFPCPPWCPGGSPLG
jgi:hypothetical protein